MITITQRLLWNHPVENIDVTTTVTTSGTVTAHMSGLKFVSVTHIYARTDTAIITR
jgi:hypothetical protein